MTLSISDPCVLHCYSSGGSVGRRYSALVATFSAGIYAGRTIEYVYQMAKRDEFFQPLGASPRECKGKTPIYFFIAGQFYPANDVQQVWYRMLWHVFFLQHPSLLKEACRYKGFFDKYEGRGARVYEPMPGYQHGEKVAQSAAIASLVYQLKEKEKYVYPTSLQAGWEELTRR